MNVTVHGRMLAGRISPCLIVWNWTLILKGSDRKMGLSGKQELVGLEPASTPVVIVSRSIHAHMYSQIYIV